MEEDQRSQISSNSFQLAGQTADSGSKKLLRITYWLAYQGNKYFFGVGMLGCPPTIPSRLFSSCTVISLPVGPACHQMFMVMTLYETVPDAAPAGLDAPHFLFFLVYFSQKRQMGWISIVIVLLFIIYDLGVQSFPHPSVSPPPSIQKSRIILKIKIIIVVI